MTTYRRGGRLSIDEGPDMSSANYRVIIYKQRHKRWVTWRVVHTQGTRDTVRVNPKAGVYRIVVPRQNNATSSVVKRVRLRR